MRNLNGSSIEANSIKVKNIITKLARLDAKENKSEERNPEKVQKMRARLGRLQESLPIPIAKDVSYWIAGTEFPAKVVAYSGSTPVIMMGSNSGHKPGRTIYARLGSLSIN